MQLVIRANQVLEGDMIKFGLDEMPSVVQYIQEHPSPSESGKIFIAFGISGREGKERLRNPDAEVILVQRPYPGEKQWADMAELVEIEAEKTFVVTQEENGLVSIRMLWHESRQNLTQLCDTIVDFLLGLTPEIEQRMLSCLPPDHPGHPSNANKEEK